jgi:hypothetical protein
MSDDPETILPQVAEADEQFRELVEFVQSPNAHGSTAYDVELSLFHSVMALGRSLLRVFMNQKAAASGPPSGGVNIAAHQHSWQTRRYISVFGPIEVRRRYYQLEEGGGSCPVDAELALGRRCYSDLLRSWLEFAVAGDAYDEAVGLLERIFRLPLSKRVAERLAAEDSADVDAFYLQKHPPDAAEEGTILVVQVDGKGVRMANPPEDRHRPTQKKEAVVTAVYSVEPYARNAQAIADTLAGKPRDSEHTEGKPRPEPVAKELRATLAGKEVAFDDLQQAVAKRDGPHFRHRVALTDGDPALQSRVLERLPNFTLILDVVHVTGYVRDACAAILGERNPMLKDYVACRLDELLAGRVAEVIAILEDPWRRSRKLSSDEMKTVTTSLGYLRRNAAYMRYDEYLAKGWPIATGVIEGAAGHLVKDRMEQAGMKWRPTGAQAVLNLRAVRVNGHWDEYQGFRRKREHMRLYRQSDFTAPPEVQIMAQAA